MSFVNPDVDAICARLRKVKTVAVVGLSPNETRPSFRIARALQRTGMRIVPVRPMVEEVLGEAAYSKLSEVPFPVDLVDVFRAAEHLEAIVDECIALRVPALWIQDGIVDESAAARARDAGIWVVMDRCIWRDLNGICRAQSAG